MSLQTDADAALRAIVFLIKRVGDTHYRYISVRIYTESPTGTGTSTYILWYLYIPVRAYRNELY